MSLHAASRGPALRPNPTTILTPPDEGQHGVPPARSLWAEALMVRESFQRFMPAFGYLDFDAGSGVEHLHIPSDLYTVSLRCEDRRLEGVRDGVGLEVVIYSVQDRARRFKVADRRQTAVASLTPLGMVSLFRTSLHGLTNRPVPLEYLCGKAEERRLAASLHAARTVSGRVETFARWIEERILEAPRPDAVTWRAASAATVMGRERGTPSVVDLASAQGITRRQLERDFRSRLGFSPGLYGRLVRFQRAAADVAQGRSFLHIAAEHGFSDQSHMTRSFREYATVTPGKLAMDGIRPGRDRVRAGLAGRVFMLDVAPPASAPLDLDGLSADARDTRMELVSAS
jgi:AraC-like DNA-binding protein